MERLKILKPIVLVFLICISSRVAEAALFLIADADLRYRNIDFEDDEFKVEALGLGLRKVFADERGDRIIFFTLIDFMHNFEKIMVDQAYGQYKGPLGKWNITLGRYLLPFGLLPNYRTNRLLIKSLEYETIGRCSDNGLRLSGMIMDFDYAISLSQGVEVQRWADIDRSALITFRVGYQGVDFEDLRIGLSGLSGRIMPDKIHRPTEEPAYKNLLALDLIKYSGLMVQRGELTLGEEEDKRLIGIFAGVDHALFPRTDLNLGYTYLSRGVNEKSAITVGLTYNILGFQVRVTQKLSLGGDKDELSFQAYRLFTRTF